MSNPLQVGITGGIGAGKTLVCEIFNKLGAPIYNADERARWLMNNEEKIKNQLIPAFGEESYKSDGTLNRDHIASIVFNNEEKLNQLNSIVHPVVGTDYQDWLKANSAQEYVVKEAALMFTSGAYKTLDKVVSVLAPEEMRIARVVKRDPFRSEKEIKAIVGKQVEDKMRIELSDYVIYNDEDQMLIPQVLRLHTMFSR